ncbi:MAG: M20 family metallopeptidase [Candidatus Obscuribacterales bacterium]
MEKTLERADALKEETIAWRRHLHSIAEMSFKETETAKFVAGKLEEFGYKVRSPLAGTGLIADRDGGSGASGGSGGSGETRHPTVALRAELDGFPVQETNRLAYSSKNAGVMHSCGHDANMASTLAAAKILSERDFPGRIRIIMQPASEVAAGEDLKSGAQRMIEDGALEGVDAVIGLHVDSTIDSGKVGIIEEPVVAKTRFFTIVFEEGRALDPVHAGARVIDALFNEFEDWSVEDRKKALAVTGLAVEEEGTRKAVVRGTLEYFSRDMLSSIKTRLQAACQKGAGGECRLDFDSDHPAEMDPAIVDAVREVSLKLLGADAVKILKRKTWTEDFSNYAQALPAALLLLGTGATGKPRIAHTGGFDIDESHLHSGAAILAESALSILKKLST